jgi:glycerol uptake facilitator-like aquaporin
MIPYVAEFVGTFALLTSILFSGQFLIVGATLAFIVWSIAEISGANVNPVVSLVMYMKGALSMNELLMYSISQALGGAAAYYTFTMLQ